VLIAKKNESKCEINYKRRNKTNLIKNKNGRKKKKDTKRKPKGKE
jgi:hypothetical protein